MTDKERLVNFTLLEQEYSFYTGASERELEEILSLVRDLVESSVPAQRVGNIPVNKTAIMACLNLASRYIKLRKDFEKYKENNELRAEKMVKMIDDYLLSEKRE